MKLKKSQKLMIYVNNFCIYTTVGQLQDKKLLDLLNQMGDSWSIGTNIDGQNVQINILE
jgi:hypothetical protein